MSWDLFIHWLKFSSWYTQVLSEMLISNLQKSFQFSAANLPHLSRKSPASLLSRIHFKFLLTLAKTDGWPSFEQRYLKPQDTTPTRIVLPWMVSVNGPGTTISEQLPKASEWYMQPLGPYSWTLCRDFILEIIGI